MGWSVRVLTLTFMVLDIRPGWLVGDGQGGLAVTTIPWNVCLDIENSSRSLK